MKKIARIFKALSDETRLRIISLLTVGELCVCDLMAILQLPQSTVSRHLAYLKNVALVDDRREGVWTHYKLIVNDDEIQSLISDLPLRLSKVACSLKDHQALQLYLSTKAIKPCKKQ